MLIGCGTGNKIVTMVCTCDILLVMAMTTCSVGACSTIAFRSVKTKSKTKVDKLAPLGVDMLISLLSCSSRSRSSYFLKSFQFYNFSQSSNFKLIS
jgi:hypothetical protein